MADTDAEVEVPVEGEVTVQLDGTEPAPAPKAAAETPTEPKPEPKPGPTPRVRPTEPPEEQASKALQEAVGSERKLREAAEATAAAALQQADAARRRVQEAENRRVEAEAREQETALARINSNIEGATAAIAAAQREYAAAMAEGNFEKAAEANTKVSRGTAALERWTGQKEDFEARKTAEPTHEGRVEEPTTSGMSAFEQYVQGFSDPRAQSWLRAHSDCVPVNAGGNLQKNQKMMAGHYSALAQGHPPNTPEYFRVIEETIGERQPAVTAPKTEEPTPPARETRQARPSAPPSREPPGTPSAGGARSVRLNKDEQDAARLSFPHLKSDQERFAAYAKNKLELEAEGKLGRTTH